MLNDKRPGVIPDRPSIATATHNTGPGGNSEDGDPVVTFADYLTGLSADDRDSALARARVRAINRADSEDIGEPSSWLPIDLGPIVAGEQVTAPPAYGMRRDGVGLIYAGKVHDLKAEPESAKGWFALHECVHRIKDGDHVVYLDFEDDAESIVERLRALGAEPTEIAERFHYVNPDGPCNEEALAALDAIVGEFEPTVVVIDGVTEALALDGIDIRDNSGVAEWLNRLPKRFKRHGCAVLLIDHVTKSGDGRGRWSIGAQHKLAGIDVSYGFRMTQDWGRGMIGTTIITVEKDRPGHVKRHAIANRVVARMTGESSRDDGSEMRVTLHEPSNEDGVFRPTTLMERVSRAIEAEPGLNVREIRALGKKAAYLDTARKQLITEGYVRPEQDGASVRHYSIRPFREHGGEEPPEATGLDI